MSQPTPYVRETSFTDFSTEHPQSQQPGVSLDAEFDGIKETLDDTLTNLALIQRDDGALRNQSVGPDQLTAEAIALIGGDTAEATALAITARNDAEGFRDEAEGFRDESEAFRDTASDEADAASADAALTALDRIAVALMKSQVITAADAALVAAFLTNGIYPDVATGEAATVDGDGFVVVETGVDGIGIYENVSGTGTLRRTIPDTGMVPFTGGAAGSFFHKLSGRDNDSGFLALADFGKQIQSAIDLTDGATWQVVGTDTGDFTAVIDVDEVVFTSTAAVGQHTWIATSEPIEVGNTYYAAGTFTDMNAGLGGLTIGLTTTAPTLGGAAANITAEAFGITYRENGGLVSYDDSGDLSEAGVSFDPGGLGMPFVEGQLVEMFLTPLTATTAGLTVFVDGLVAVEKRIAGLTTGNFFCAGWNLRADAQEARLSAAVINLRSLDLPLRVVVDAAAAGGGDGSPDSPFNNFDDVNALIAREKRRRHLAVYGRGVFEGQCLYADQNQWRQIEVIGSIGEEFVIDASVAFAPVWTQIGATDRWYATHPGYDDNNSGYGGLIEVTSGIEDVFGLNGDFTVADEVIQNRLAIDTDPASALYVNGDYGSFSIHTLATYVAAGSVVVRCADGGDPNAKTWRWIRKEGAINFAPADDTELMACHVRMVNVTGKRAFVYNVRAERSILDFINVRAPGGLGFGFQLNHSCGRVFACSADGTMLDNCHWSDAGTALEEQLDTLIDACVFRGAASRPYGVGDNLSNHNPLGHRVTVRDSQFISAGKHGISTNGAIEVINCLLQDGIQAGFSHSASAGVSGQTSKLTGCELTRNYDGCILNLGALTDIVSEVELELCHFHDNSNTDLRGFASGAGSAGHTIIDRCSVSGPVPPGEGNRIVMEDANSTYEFIAADEFSEATRT